MRGPIFNEYCDGEEYIDLDPAAIAVPPPGIVRDAYGRDDFQKVFLGGLRDE